MRLFLFYFFLFCFDGYFFAIRIGKMATTASGKSATKRKRHDLTLKEKFDVIQQVKQHVPYGKIANAFNCSSSQICRIAQNRAEIETSFEENLNSNAKRMKAARNRDINEAVWRWYQTIAAKNIPVTGL